MFAATTDDCKDTKEQSDYPIAAVGSSQGSHFAQQSRGGQNRPKGGRGGQRPQSSNSSSLQEPSQAQQAGLYRNHLTYGKKTYNCGGNYS